MNWQDELQHDTGQIVEPGEHPNGCICTGCTTERLLARGFTGRYDQYSTTELQGVKNLRELRVPRSAGTGEYMATGAAPAEPPPTPEKAA